MRGHKHTHTQAQEGGTGGGGKKRWVREGRRSEEGRGREMRGWEVWEGGFVEEDQQPRFLGRPPRDPYHPQPAPLST